MENAPTPTNDNQPEPVLNQPDVAETAQTDVPVVPVFNFSSEQPVVQKTFEETTNDINDQSQATQVFDPSDANIESGNSILRDLTPAEIEEKAKNDQNAEQLATSKGKFVSNIMNKLFHRG